MKEFYWADGLTNFRANNNEEFIEIKRLNFYIGKNNAGKSRFLRQLFVSNKTFQDYNTIDKLDFLDQAIKQSNNIHFQGGYNFNQELVKLSDTLNKIITSPSNNASIISEIYNEVNSQKYDHLKGRVTNNFWEEFSTKYKRIQIKKLFQNKSYIPILRGMRPIIEKSDYQPYVDRTCKDYFNNNKKLYNSKNLITGECLYYEITAHLLGEPEQRELMKSYEEKLSQYFFDNEPVSLIPKHGSDVVHIKIGADKQFPIYQLGDGLQQAIILTYEAFLKKDEVHAFFIEEPELHMHPGMVRQLMNFYLNETQHYYFFTTHSNHLLDMADESDQVIIQKYVKESNPENPNMFDFKIYRCDRDRELLATLGVKPSSVYLANCTIWVEGITDRLYISKYMAKYLQQLKTSNLDKYKKYLRFMPNYHYAFVEYAGSNIAHWSFNDEYVDQLEDKGLSAKAITTDMLLIADGDNYKNMKRVNDLIKELNNDHFHILDCKETENTLPFNSIISVAKLRFDAMRSRTKNSYDIKQLDLLVDVNYFVHKEYGIGRLLDESLIRKTSKSTKTLFAEGEKGGVGTIKDKTKFCRAIIKYMDENPDWQLTPEAERLCAKIYQHIERCNG